MQHTSSEIINKNVSNLSLPQHRIDREGLVSKILRYLVLVCKIRVIHWEGSHSGNLQISEKRNTGPTAGRTYVRTARNQKEKF